MKTERLTAFVAALVRNNIKHEVHDHETLESVKHIGFTYGRGTWHWFTWLALLHVESEAISFTHSYSQVNGKTKKGFRHSMKVCRSLQKKLQLSDDIL